MAALRIGWTSPNSRNASLHSLSRSETTRKVSYKCKKSDQKNGDRFRRRFSLAASTAPSNSQISRIFFNHY